MGSYFDEKHVQVGTQIGTPYITPLMSWVRLNLNHRWGREIAAQRLQKILFTNRYRH
ncbi:MAG: hypothetical protein HMLIMOIP_001080 [Candidatus Nitrosomirales archaeon]|jgi:hypothetical protein